MLQKFFFAIMMCKMNNTIALQECNKRALLKFAVHHFNFRFGDKRLSCSRFPTRKHEAYCIVDYINNEVDSNLNCAIH